MGTTRKREYEARLDAKRRIHLRAAESDRFSVLHRPDGSILLRPLVVTIGRKPADQETPEDKRARLQRLIDEGKVPASSMQIIDFRPPTAAEIAYGNTLAPQMRRCLARGRRRKKVGA